MWRLAVLTGDCINAGFFCKELFGCFAGPEKSGRNNKVSTVRRGSTVICLIKTKTKKRQMLKNC